MKESDNNQGGNPIKGMNSVQPTASVSEQSTDETGILLLYRIANARHLELNVLLRELYINLKEPGQ